MFSSQNVIVSRISSAPVSQSWQLSSISLYISALSGSSKSRKHSLAITEVETAIENRIAELEEEYELDIYDRNDIREEEYQKAGWRHDPFPEELEEEDEEEKEDWHYHSMEERLNEVGMSMRDFF